MSDGLVLTVSGPSQRSLHAASLDREAPPSAVPHVHPDRRPTGRTCCNSISHWQSDTRTKISTPIPGSPPPLSFFYFFILVPGTFRVSSAASDSLPPHDVEI